MGEISTPTVATTGLEVHGVAFPALVTPPGSCKAHFLGGAGVRGLKIEEKFLAVTAIAIYLENDAVKTLADKWKGKGAEELSDSMDFFTDIYTGPFEKFTQVVMLLPLTGDQYTAKVSENCVAYWKATGIYTDAEAAAIEKFKQVFRNQSFPPGSSILFTHSPTGSLTIAFSKDASIPEAGAAVIENKALTQAVLESIIGEHGVSPAAKQSLALRLSEILNKAEDVESKVPTKNSTCVIREEIQNKSL